MKTLIVILNPHTYVRVIRPSSSLFSLFTTVVEAVDASCIAFENRLVFQPCYDPSSGFVRSEKRMQLNTAGVPVIGCDSIQRSPLISAPTNDVSLPFRSTSITDNFQYDGINGRADHGQSGRIGAADIGSSSGGFVLRSMLHRS